MQVQLLVRNVTSKTHVRSSSGSPKLTHSWVSLGALVGGTRRRYPAGACALVDRRLHRRGGVGPADPVARLGVSRARQGPGGPVRSVDHGWALCFRSWLD